MLPITIRRHEPFGQPTFWPTQDFDRFFRQLWQEDQERGELTGAYPVDIREDDNSILVDAELPGFKREEVNVSIDHGVLRITAERESGNGEGIPHLSERRFTRVERAFTLPTAVHETKAEAKLADGVLHLRLPKTAESKPRRIKVM